MSDHQTRGVSPSRGQVVALSLALLFLAGSVGFVVGSRTGADDAPSDEELGFLTDMVIHHEQAVSMSRTALSASMPEGVASFALEVVADQRYEIGIMEALLQRWGSPPDDADGEAMAWMGEPVAEDAMPGLASEADLDRLSDARGDEAAALWLAMMTAHHEGGVHMAEAAAERVDDPYVQALAERMARVQAIEINEYEAVRNRLGLPVPTGLQPMPMPAPSASGVGSDEHHGG